METFADIWERDARWIAGPGLLAMIVEHLQGRSVEAHRRSGDNNALDVGLPVPLVRDAVSGNLVSVACFIPDELNSVYESRVDKILQRRLPDVRACSLVALGAENTPLTLNNFNAALLRLEQERMARGSGDELWRVAAEEFGLNPYALPTPLFTTEYR